MKHFTAIIAALLITTVIGLGIMVVGVSAINNPNTVPLQNSPGNASSTTSNTSVSQNDPPASTAAQVQQLQQQVSDLQSQLSQASQQIQQYQAFIVALQQRGIITIDQNGNIFLNLRGGSNDH